MASPLESAITLEDVFAMVTGKRVPLAPELAGYLSLEIAEKAEAGGAGGDIDPRSVYIADEGTVALVRPRTEPSEGDAEQSIRAILGQLLEASGSSTPALSGVSRRGRAGSLRALMEDIEAALIPVNRAAGRRALARLAREVKRVTHGVGRNAPSGRAPSGEWLARGSRPDARPEAPPARREPPEPKPAPQPARTALPPVVPPPVAAQPVLPPPVTARSPEATPPPREPARQPEPEPPPPPPPPPAIDMAAMFGTESDVDSLLERFGKSTSPSEQDVSRELKGLVDIGETAVPPQVQPSAPKWVPPAEPMRLSPSFPPPSRERGSAPPPPSPDVDDLLAFSEEAAPPPAAKATAASASPARAAPPASVRSTPPIPTSAPSPSSSRPPAVNPRELPTHQSMPVAEWSRPRKKRTDYWIVIAILVLLASASAVVWQFKPGFISGRTAEKVAEEKAANEALRQKMALAQQALLCHAALDVTDVPSGAEVLLRVGQAPVDVPHLPVGARLEFVGTAEGYAPKRVVVPGGAPWDNGPDGKPRFELAVELNRSNPKAKQGDPWPPGEAGSEVGGKGAPGTVHVVSTPRGAEIWMLAGLGPEALVEQLPCDQSVEVLVAGPTTFRKRLKAAATDFVTRPGEQSSRMAKLSAK